LCSCATIKGTDTTSQTYLNKQFKKICLEGSGKGRIELVGSKYTFGYESLVNKQKNVFDLALDFPIIGETQVTLSLNPAEVSKQIGKTELVEVLRDKIGDRPDKNEILKTIKEFFVFASDFVRYKAAATYPSHFNASSENGHFVLFRETPHYKFSVDNFSDNETYFERTVFQIYLKGRSVSDPIMTLFLVPQKCDR
jgi:hypothetical protein